MGLIPARIRRFSLGAVAPVFALCGALTTTWVGGCGAQAPQAPEAAAATDAPAPLPPPIGEPPTLLASSSISGFVFPGDEVELTGIADDPDEPAEGPAPVVNWVQIAGSAVSLEPTDVGRARFTVPPDVVPGETLGFELSGQDAAGNVSTRPLYLFVPRGPGVVLAKAGGPADPVNPGDEVRLVSLGSLNIPGGTATYRWEQTAGPTVELSNADQTAASFIAPDPGAQGAVLVFRLTLENNGVTDTDETQVMVAGGAE